MNNYYKGREEKCIKEIKDFKEKNGDWPRAQDIPNVARLLQRKFGGLVAFRKQHNLGYENYTKGEYRSASTKTLNIRGHKAETEVFDFLVKKYGRSNIHREYMYYFDNRNRADFCVFKDNNEFLMIDCFYPGTEYTLKGCLNLKYKKYKDYIGCPIIFIQMNESISDNVLKDIINNRKNKLNDNMYVVNFNDLPSLLDSLHPQHFVV